jgi:hypothetical protein
LTPVRLDYLDLFRWNRHFGHGLNYLYPLYTHKIFFDLQELAHLIQESVFSKRFTVIRRGRGGRRWFFWKSIGVVGCFWTDCQWG